MSFTKLKELSMMSLLRDTNNYRMMRVNILKVHNNKQAKNTQ